MERTGTFSIFHTPNVFRGSKQNVMTVARLLFISDKIKTSTCRQDKHRNDGVFTLF